jgi:hypothetical protein
MIRILVLIAGLSFNPIAYAGQATLAVPQQNELVAKYCAVCHYDAHPNGGLSLEHFDAERVEPSLAAMMVSKLKSGAMGAAGIERPPQPTQDALQAALTAKSAGAEEWALSRPQAHIVSTSIVRSVPSSGELYRLKLSCRGDTREAELQLTWSPNNAGDSVRVMSVAVDGGIPVIYKVEGHEKMGNGSKKADGTDITTGPAAAVLEKMPLPSRTLTVSNVFPNEIVVFPFDGLTPSMRQELSTCFVGKIF